ncbi:MAG: hypothetical protein IJ867_07825 [Clostridia bacterium]|nr:hypothetical protein [Clostridia bacterium]
MRWFGDNGIITQAMKAKEMYQKAGGLEDLQVALVDYSLSSFLNEKEALDTVVNGLFRKELIDWIDGDTDDSGNIIDYNQYTDENGNLYVWVKKGENSYRVFLNSDDTYTADEMPLAGGGTLKGGTHIVTQEAFAGGEGVSPEEKGKFTIEGDTKVVFKNALGVDETGMKASGEKLSIYVEKNANVQLYFNYDKETKASDGKTYYFLTNEGLSRSAIDVAAGGVLDLYIAENVIVTVDSGFGKEGVTASALGAAGGPGGFAGIHIPWYDSETTGISGERDDGEYAVLNLYGKGKLVAYGGNAGKGGGAVSGNTGGGRRRTEPVLELEVTAEKVGQANTTFKFVMGLNGRYGDLGNSGKDGGNGENCGEINIYEDLEIYCYGGSGGAGGTDVTRDSGSGAGGYPAARNWWRRRRSAVGGDHANSAGGFTCGTAEHGTTAGKNGSGSGRWCRLFLRWRWLLFKRNVKPGVYNLGSIKEVVGTLEPFRMILLVAVGSLAPVEIFIFMTNILWIDFIVIMEIKLQKRSLIMM